MSLTARPIPRLARSSLHSYLNSGGEKKDELDK